MPRDDRERNFENALARNLQANTPAGSQSNAPASSPASHSASASDCPDAEILAAYHERLLSPEEMISRKEHIAVCPRCQEILAQLEATDEISLEADQEEFAPLQAVAVPRMPVLQAAQSSARPPAQEVAAQRASRLEVPRRSANWRWLAPAGALAAILLVWVALHERSAQEFKLAQNQHALAPEVSPPAAPPAPQPLSKEESARKDSSAEPATKVAVPRITDALHGERNAPHQKVLPSAPLSKLAEPNGSPRLGDSIAAKRAVQTQSRVLAQSPDEDQQRAAAPQSSAATAPSITESPVNSVAPAPAILGPSRAKKAEAAAGTAAEPTLHQLTRVGALATRENVTSFVAQNSVPVSSPDGTVTWRLASSGIVQRSDDGGSNWTLQKTAVVTDLLAGSATTNNVCWIVGRAGTILLTTDGGKHWRKTSSPTTGDIASVFAVNAEQATITTTTKNSYQTSDAGITWIPVANP
jgi:Photosynthesis system II assembly factor YCF48